MFCRDTRTWKWGDSWEPHIVNMFIHIFHFHNGSEYYVFCCQLTETKIIIYWITGSELEQKPTSEDHRNNSLELIRQGLVFTIWHGKLCSNGREGGPIPGFIQCREQDEQKTFTRDLYHWPAWDLRIRRVRPVGDLCAARRRGAASCLGWTVTKVIYYIVGYENISLNLITNLTECCSLFI